MIAEWDRNSREVIRVALDKYNGRHTIINARVWYRDGGEFKPGKAGMTLALSTFQGSPKPWGWPWSAPTISAYG